MFHRIQSKHHALRWIFSNKSDTLLPSFHQHPLSTLIQSICHPSPPQELERFLLNIPFALSNHFIIIAFVVSNLQISLTSSSSLLFLTLGAKCRGCILRENQHSLYNSQFYLQFRVYTYWQTYNPYFCSFIVVYCFMAILNWTQNWQCRTNSLNKGPGESQSKCSELTKAWSAHVNMAHCERSGMTSWHIAT